MILGIAQQRDPGSDCVLLHSGDEMKIDIRESPSLQRPCPGFGKGYESRPVYSLLIRDYVGSRRFYNLLSGKVSKLAESTSPRQVSEAGVTVLPQIRRAYSLLHPLTMTRFFLLPSPYNSYRDYSPLAIYWRVYSSDWSGEMCPPWCSPTSQHPLPRLT